MGKLICLACNTEYEGTKRARCPKCLSGDWTRTQDFLGTNHKHDDSYHSAWPVDRTIVINARLSASAYAEMMAYSAAPYYNTSRGNTTYISTAFAGESVPGSLVPSGNMTGVSGVSALAVVDGHGTNPHMYPPTAVNTGVGGPLVPYSKCPVPGCDNLSYDYGSACGGHLKPPKAKFG